MFDIPPQQYLAALGAKRVTAGAVDTLGLLDMPSSVVAGGMVISTDYKLTYETAALPDLDFDDLIYVDGQPYTVRTAKPTSDGVFSEAEMTKK